MTSGEKVQRYTFKPLEFGIPSDKEIRETLFRWNLQDNLKIYKFRYDYEFLSYNTSAFIEDLLGSVDTLAGLGLQDANSPTEFKLQSASLLNTNFFDTLLDSGLVSNHGEICQIIPQYLGNLEIPTKVMQAILKFELEEAEIEYPFTDIEGELLFDIFKILMIGGPYNQRDYDIDTYRKCLKTIYKPLVE